MKMMKKFALVIALVLALSMLAACENFQGFIYGSNYSKVDSMKGDPSTIPAGEKQAVEDVPYSGPKPVVEVDTDDPVKAGLCDETGKMADGSGIIDVTLYGYPAPSADAAE